MKDIHQKAIRYLTYLVLNNLQSHLLKRGPCLFTTRAHLPKRHNSSCYNTVHHVKHLDNGLTFMPVQCIGVIFILFSFYTQIYLSTMYGVSKKPHELLGPQYSSHFFALFSKLNEETRLASLCP